MWETLIAAQDLGRVRTLAATLVRYGFGDAVRRLGLARALARLGKVLPLGALEAQATMPTPVRVRRALEEMGPSFVKLGQVLATRVDLLPPDWISELGRLQNAVPSVPFDAIRAELTLALGEAPERAFAWFDPHPLAAASIAQVHRARLHDGREVVVKVRRPGICATVEADLRLLQYAAKRIEAKFPDLRRFDPTGVVRQFRDSLRRELDFSAECRNAERVAASFAGDGRIVIPSVHWPYTREAVNVQDFIDGVPVADLAALDAAGLDRKKIASAGADLVLKMILDDGFFHADPHPGNILVLPDGRIGLIDFGMVGRLSPARRTEVIGLLAGLVDRDAEHVSDVLLDWTLHVGVDERQLAADVDAFVDHYHGVPLGQLDLAGMLLETTAILRAHRLSLPADLALLIKACLTLEGLGRSLDPDFDMAGHAQPYLHAALKRQVGMRDLARRGTRALIDVTALLSALPHELRRLLRLVRESDGRLHLELDELEDFGQRVSHSANRLAGAMVIAALIVGSSIAMTVDGGPELFGLPFFAGLGFVAAIVAGLWLLASIFRSGGGR